MQYHFAARGAYNKELAELVLIASPEGFAENMTRNARDGRSERNGGNQHSTLHRDTLFLLWRVDVQKGKSTNQIVKYPYQNANIFIINTKSTAEMKLFPCCFLTLVLHGACFSDSEIPSR